MEEEKTTLQKFDELILKGEATWWEMILPSGDVFLESQKQIC